MPEKNPSESAQQTDNKPAMYLGMVLLACNLSCAEAEARGS